MQVVQWVYLQPGLQQVHVLHILCCHHDWFSWILCRWMTLISRTWATMMPFECFETSCTSRGEQQQQQQLPGTDEWTQAIQFNIQTFTCVFATRPITLTVAKCWDPNPRSCFALPRSECSASENTELSVGGVDNLTGSDLTPCIRFHRWTNPTHRPSCLGVPHGGHDRGVPSVWHEPFHEHRHLHQLLYQQLHPRDWTWAPPKHLQCFAASPFVLWQ